jgi:hypothetical protein
MISEYRQQALAEETSALLDTSSSNHPFLAGESGVISSSTSAHRRCTWTARRTGLVLAQPNRHGADLVLEIGRM